MVLSGNNFPMDIGKSAKQESVIPVPVQTKEKQAPDLDLAAEPLVTVIWSESSRLRDGQQMPLHEANALFTHLDASCPADAGCDKTKFRIDCIFQGGFCSYKGRQDFGDADGSLLEHIKKYHEFYEQDKSWKKYIILKNGIEGWNQDKAERDILLGEFVTYLKLHCNLAQMERVAQECLHSEGNLMPEEVSYWGAVLSYVQECRSMLNQGQYHLPKPPKLFDFGQSLQNYKAQVQAETVQEAAEANMTIEEYAANDFEPYYTTVTQKVRSTEESQAKPTLISENFTDLQKKAIKIFEKYKNLSIQDKVNIIAQAFGCTTGKIKTSPCYGKWRGTSDVSIKFDNGTSLFIGNNITSKAKTVKVQAGYIDSALMWFNLEIVSVAKEVALAALMKREIIDNAIATQKGLKPYSVLNVEFNNGADKESGGYMGWYYLTIVIDGKIRTHIETGLNHDIAHGKVSEIPERSNYFTAGGLKDADVDYVFNNVGFSSSSDLYSLPISDAVRDRAEKTLAKRICAQENHGG